MLKESSIHHVGKLAMEGAHSRRGGDTRTLYLGQDTCQRVDASGESLVITAQRTGESSRQLRFPLQRVARVVSSTAIDWSGKALQVCLEHQLSICWLDGKGNALGSLYSNRAEPSSFSTALDLMLETHEGFDRYHGWLKSRRMEVQLQWGKTSSLPIPPQEWEAAKRSWVYQGRLDAPHLPKPLHGLVAACVSQQLQEQQLSPVQHGPNGAPLLLAHDLTWLVWAEMNFCCGPMADQVDQQPEIMLFFERWYACNGGSLFLHLESLRRCANKETRT